MTYVTETDKFRQRKFLNWIFSYNKWEEFTKAYREEYHELKKRLKDCKEVKRQSFNNAAQKLYPHKWKEFNELWKRNLRRKKLHSSKFISPKDIEKKEESRSTDVLDDIRWVYNNMSRLFIVDKHRQVEELSRKVLNEAPSPGG